MSTTTFVKSGHQRAVSVVIDEDVLKSAQRRDSSHCMIADAIRAQNPGVNRVAVDLATIRFTDPKRGLRYVYLTPPLAQRALIRFDQGQRNEPFEFTLRRAAQITQAGGRSRGEKRPSTAKNGVVGGKRSKGQGSNTPTLIGGRALPANAALGEGRGRIRSYGLQQLVP